MIEFFHTKPERVSFVQYGFHYKEAEVLNQTCIEPDTIEGLDMELRAFAIEYHLINDNPLLSIDREFYITQKAKLCTWLADFINILALGHLDSSVVGYSNEPRIQWCAERLDSLIDNYDIATIKAQWPNIMQRLNQSTLHEDFDPLNL